jgi:hypothetical protein
VAGAVPGAWATPESAAAGKGALATVPFAPGAEFRTIGPLTAAEGESPAFGEVCVHPLAPSAIPTRSDAPQIRAKRRAVLPP